MKPFRLAALVLLLAAMGTAQAGTLVDLTSPGAGIFDTAIVGTNSRARQTFIAPDSDTLLSSLTYFIQQSDFSFSSSYTTIDLYAWNGNTTTGSLVGDVLWSSGRTFFSAPTSFAHNMPSPLKQLDFNPGVILNAGETYAFSFAIESKGQYLLANSGYTGGSASLYSTSLSSWVAQPDGSSLALQMRFEPAPVAAVPAPPAYLLMLTGLALLAALPSCRRRLYYKWAS